MRESLVRDLGNGPATLDFLVQRWPDLSTLPEWAVEDATRRWPHPWVRAARIVIPPHSEPEICARDADAEHFSFQPWRVSPEHQPLGGISRTRLAVYKEMSKFRNELNGIRQTPNGH